MEVELVLARFAQNACGARLEAPRLKGQEDEALHAVCGHVLVAVEARAREVSLDLLVGRDEGLPLCANAGARTHVYSGHIRVRRAGLALFIGACHALDTHLVQAAGWVLERPCAYAAAGHLVTCEAPEIGDSTSIALCGDVLTV